MNDPTPSMPCPECETPIPLDVQALLSGVAAVCPGCGARLELDTQGSQDALRAFTAARAALDEVGRGGR